MMWPKTAPSFLWFADVFFFLGAVLIHGVFLISFKSASFLVPDSQTQQEAGSVQLTVTRLKEDLAKTLKPSSVQKEKNAKKIQKRLKRVSQQTSKQRGVESFDVQGREGLERTYVSLIQERLEKFKSYPLSSRQEGEQGRVVLFFKINKQGQVLEKSVLKTSGYRDLDEATLEALSQAAPLPPIPSEVGKETMVFKVPFLFSLF